MAAAHDACEAIRRLHALYAQLLDSKRLEAWGDLFTPDAVFRVWDTRLEGRDAIVREIGGMQPDSPGKHVILQPVIDLEGDDRARSWTDLASLASGEDGITIATIGRYHDRLVRDAGDGRWRFAERVIVMADEAVPEDVAPSPER